MNKSIIEKFIDRGCAKWGTTKTYLVLFLALAGFGSFGSAAIAFIPNRPELEEPQIEVQTKSTKK